MKAAVTIALVCLAGLGAGCDAVVGSGQLATAPGTIYFDAGSQNSGTEPWGTVTWRTCCPQEFTLEVICLRVVGNRATIGTESLPPGEGTRLWYIEDNPGGQDMLDLDSVPSTLTVCPDPPEPNPNYEALDGNVDVIDDYAP
jgi:hypothetical protein